MKLYKHIMELAVLILAMAAYKQIAVLAQLAEYFFSSK